MSLVPVQAPAPPTIARETLVEAYLSARQANGDLTSKDSARPVRSILRRFLEVVGDRLPDVSAEDVEVWLAAQSGDKPGTVRARVTIVRPFCRWLVANGHALADPTADIDVGKRWSRGRERPATVVIPVEVVERVPVRLPDAIPVCADCELPTDRPRRLSGVGRPLCTVCWQRARRRREPDTTFGVSVSQHLHRELAALGLSPRTVLLYAQTIQRAERWFVDQGWHLAAAQSHQVVTYLGTRPGSSASRSLHRCAFRVYWELVGHPKPPMRAMRVPPKPEMVCRALDEDAARILAKAARASQDARGLAVILGLYQAMRREEIAGTRWDAIRDGDWLTIIGKGTKTRTIPLHPITVEALSHVPITGEWVFPGRFGGHCSPATIWEWITHLADEAGVAPVRPHELRHTCLATQNDRTGDLRAVQAFAGHSKPETTSGYTRAKKTALRKVVDAVDY